MPTPLEFGYAVGEFTKSAHEKSARNMLADMALYSNPYTGVPTGIYDTARNLYHGKYLNALGSLASTGMSFLGGNLLSGAAKSVGGALGKGMTQAGTSLAARGATAAGQAGLKGLAGRAAVQAGTALAKTPGAVASATAPVAGAVARASNAMARGVQRVIPVRPVAQWTKNPLRAYINSQVANPMSTLAGYHSSNPVAPAAQ